MKEAFGSAAPVATMVAAIMNAANLGAKVTASEIGRVSQKLIAFDGAKSWFVDDEIHTSLDAREGAVAPDIDPKD